MGKALGLDNKFAYNIIKQVGNFGEIWNAEHYPDGRASRHQQPLEQGRSTLRAADALSFTPSMAAAGNRGGLFYMADRSIALDLSLRL